MAEFPPIRACLFDMDGLLLNTEDIYTKCADIVLEKHGRPPPPWSIKAKLMGIPGSSNGDYKEEQAAQQRELFPACRPLPGVKQLLINLKEARTQTIFKKEQYPLQIGLATSSIEENFKLKTVDPSVSAVIDAIPLEHRVLGDDARWKKSRGKPAPDIYLLALSLINDRLLEGCPKIAPNECLVFEDSVLGVEAGRRAGMRVVWVPHEGVLADWKDKEPGVLAGRTGLYPIGNDEQLGEIGDGWAERIDSLEDFQCEKYGILTS
ncbi:HAD-like protein [Xylariaceae sp. FL0255]|nr:HAD-like protein [Xylariaceae sp. FL0255]